MIEGAPDLVAAAARLRAAMEGTAAALAGADLAHLLASEAALQHALHALQTLPSPAVLAPDDRAQARRDLEAAQSALLRARRLGAALNDFVRASLDARGQTVGYDPAERAAASFAGRSLDQRA